MSTGAKQEAVDELWRQALRYYRQEGLRERLGEAWPGDRNVDGLAYKYSPTFQPGYVGPRYFGSGPQIVLMAQNPGEGSDAVSVEMNREYRGKLEAFAQGDTGFEDLNRLVASHMLRWSVFKGKGIFREGGAARMSLLDNDVRPSIEGVGYVNYFPFKTSGNRSPVNSSFGRDVWKTYVGRFLELLAPNVIVPMGAWCTTSVERVLRGLPGPPEVTRVQHPSARRPQDLQASWRSLSAYLRGLA